MIMEPLTLCIHIKHSKLLVALFIVFFNFNF
uniref:Uncharacterized protein n=1 Tax=Arundo donax TaxID=35708 RepID=A0A0A9GSS1_ARUDO